MNQMQDQTESTLWVGIDEAGYGPNLGPLVMSAVVAQGGEHAPDLWRDLPGTFRAGTGRHAGLCIDDSKVVMARRDGLEQLERAYRSIATTALDGYPKPYARECLLEVLGPDVYGGEELVRWMDDLPISPLVDLETGDQLTLATEDWRILAANIQVIGPEKFNKLLETCGNKAQLHSGRFVELVRWVQTLAAPGETVRVVSDKHGGRNFYMPLLSEAFPEIWIQNVQERTSLSHYKLTYNGVHYNFQFKPRADSENGLVALASMVSKLMRERWMERFNAWFGRRKSGLRPTAGYPVDARRFARDVSEICAHQNLPADLWWRRK